MTHHFFTSLQRRVAYSVKTDGKFYKYAYFRENFHGEIATDCKERCVYCDSHDQEMGGREAMQIDHFRPYTRTGFEHLEDDPTNFHHACGRCNLLKSDKWPSTHPSAPHDGTVGFVDPFADDRQLYFKVDSDGTLIPLQAPAGYLIRVLALNRRHLRLLRLQRIYRILLNEYEAKNLPRWEAAIHGQGMTIEELAKEFEEYRRLCQLSSPGFQET